jgi:hypothetical protein
MYYASSICDNACEHKHRTAEAAERCAAKRIAAGALRRWMGPQQPLRVPNDELFSLYVREFHDNGMRIGG